MRSLFIAACVYLGTGVASGVFYREFTKAYAFPEGSPTQLSVVHTHLLALGFTVMLIVLALDKLFGLSDRPLFRWFFWVYNAGLVVTVGMLVWHGSLTVMGLDSSEAIAGIAGLGHIALTAGLVLLMVTIGQSLPSRRLAATD